MIRAATLNDLDQVTELIRASFKPALLPYMVYAQAGIGRFLASFVEHPGVATNRVMLVADDGSGQVLGFAEFRRGSDGEAHLSYICVQRAARGRGLAVALIEHYLATFEARKIELDVFEDNVSAIALYHKLGFEQTGETMWFTRPLPPPAPRANPIELANFALSLAAFERYGFCELHLDGHEPTAKVGLIGDRVLRCFDTACFADDDLLGRLRAIFPGADEALLIGSIPLDCTARQINRSLHMSAKFP